MFIGLGRGPPGRGGIAPGFGRGPPAPGPLGRVPAGRSPRGGRSPDGRSVRGGPDGRGAAGLAEPMPVLVELKGLLPGRGPVGRRSPPPPCLGPGRGPGLGPRWPGLAPAPGAGAPGDGAPGPGAGAPGDGAPGAGALGLGAGPSGVLAPGPGRGPAGFGAAGPGRGAGGFGCTGRGAEACCGSGTPPSALTGGFGAMGLGPGGLGAAGFFGAAGLPPACGRAPAPAPDLSAGLAEDDELLENASVSLRTTGASIVEDAERTNSPISRSLAMTTLLSTPNSLASSYTRTFATALPTRSGGASSGPSLPCRTHRGVLIERS